MVVAVPLGPTSARCSLAPCLPSLGFYLYRFSPGIQTWEGSDNMHPKSFDEGGLLIRTLISEPPTVNPEKLEHGFGGLVLGSIDVPTFWLLL